MAAKPRMMVRLAPSILHALEYIAEREGTTPAELARTMLTSASQQSLDRHAWRADCQDAYMRWLSARRAQDRDDIAGDIEVDDILGGGQAPDPAGVTQSGADAPYGASATIPPLFADQELPGISLPSDLDDQAAMASRFRPDGRKRRV